MSLYFGYLLGRLGELISNRQKNPKGSEPDTALPDDLCEMGRTSPCHTVSRISHTVIDGAGAYVLPLHVSLNSGLNPLSWLAVRASECLGDGSNPFRRIWTCT